MGRVWANVLVNRWRHKNCVQGGQKSWKFCVRTLWMAPKPLFRFSTPQLNNQSNRNTTRRCRTKQCIARSWSNLVNEPEGWVHQVWPSWVQYTASFCTWVVYSFYYMPVFMQFGSVLGACNTTGNIEQCYLPMKMLDFISICN